MLRKHVMATSVADATGRFAVRTGAGTYTLEISHPGHEPHGQQVTVANAPVSVGNVRLQCRPLRLDTVTIGAERDGVQLLSGATVVDTRASAAAGGSIAELLRTVPGVEHVIPSAELSAVASVDRGRVRFTFEARTSFVDEDFRGTTMMRVQATAT